MLVIGIALNSYHYYKNLGGSLTVSHRDDIKVFDFCQDLVPRGYNRFLTNNDQGYYSLNNKLGDLSHLVDSGIAKKCISFAAFYGDALHQVDKVTAG